MEQYKLKNQTRFLMSEKSFIKVYCAIYCSCKLKIKAIKNKSSKRHLWFFGGFCFVFYQEALKLKDIVSLKVSEVGIRGNHIKVTLKNYNKNYICVLGSFLAMPWARSSWARDQNPQHSRDNNGSLTCRAIGNSGILFLNEAENYMNCTILQKITPPKQ